MKLKFCGISHLQDAIVASKLGADLLGFITEPGLLRYIKPEFLTLVRRRVEKPIVAVKTSLKFDDVAGIADVVQVHKVLTPREIEELSTFSLRFFLYVPSSREGLEYLKHVNKLSNAVPLIDSAVKGRKADLEYAKKILDERPDAGLGGGVTPDNVHEFVKLNPAWIDVSSGIESIPTKKDESKMRKIAEVVKGWT